MEERQNPYRWRMLAGIEEKRISGNRNANVQIFPGATTQDM